MLDQTTAYELDFLFPGRDTAVGASLKAHGEFSRIELDFLIEHAAETTGTLLDVGANIGAIALPFAKNRPAWRVRAIEAHRGLATILAANAMNNRLHNVDVHHAAVGAARGLTNFPTCSLADERNFGEIGYHQRDEPTEVVRLLALDELASSDTRLVKVDVEGFEAAVLAGSRQLLEKGEAIWVCEAGSSRQQTIAEFLAVGYAVYWFYVPFVAVNAERGRPDNPYKGDANIIAAPPGRSISWDLPRVGQADESRPGGAGDYPYLRRYGY